MKQEQTQDQHILLRALVDELARCGLTDACTSPGSRVTPILVPLVRHPGIRCWSHLDERSAGFFAVGAAKASGRPVALTCTSGTAAANFAPAVHEAREAGVPLIVLTADRPPELREVGAGQVIDQVRLYGSAAKWSFELEPAGATLAWVRALACRAWWTAQDGRPGVVHLNVPLRDPLVPPAALPPDASGRPDGRPWARRTAPASAPAVLEMPPRTVVVAGTGAPPDLPAAFPVLADPLSGARRGPGAVAHYDALLRDRRFVDAMRPQAVVRFGDLPTSKPLRQWLAALGDVEQVLVPGPATWPDPMSTASDVRSPGTRVAGPGDPAWVAAWRDADAAAATAIDAALGDELTEPRVARELMTALPPEATLWVASSMPVRDVETFAPVRADGGPRVLANRGANGIDGTVSSALGAAAVGGGPVTLLIGDVALAYDLSALLSVRRLGLDLTVVLLDNGGGGIFEFLPIAGAPDLFEEHIATPPGLDPARIAALFGLAHHAPRTLDAFRVALAAAGPKLVTVRTDRKANTALHARVWDAVRAR
jgi:2-succinyl-5-enolpyruvyl-6-hydroxy-3-cyclohexene-1-carboxylate synthase